MTRASAALLISWVLFLGCFFFWYPLFITFSFLFFFSALPRLVIFSFLTNKLNGPPPENEMRITRQSAQSMASAFLQFNFHVPQSIAMEINRPINGSSFSMLPASYFMSEGSLRFKCKWRVLLLTWPAYE